MALDMLIEVQRAAVMRGWRLADCEIIETGEAQVVTVAGVRVFTVTVSPSTNGWQEVVGTWLEEIPAVAVEDKGDDPSRK